MLNYKTIHYEEYHIMLEDGTSFQTDRKTCFAPAEPVTADNPYVQRWYYSPDRKLAIRLPRDENGERIGKNNAAIFQSGELLMNVMNAGKQNHSGPVPTKKARRVVT